MKAAPALLALLVPLAAQENYGPGIREVVTLPARVFDWSPDGNRLAYAVDRTLWIVEAPEFRSPRRLPLGGWGQLPNRDEEKEYPIQQIRWSPDGRRIAFLSSRAEDGWYTLWLTDAEGSEVRDLLPPEVSHMFGSPGIRAVRITSWLNAREISFSLRHRLCRGRQSRRRAPVLCKGLSGQRGWRSPLGAHR